MKNLKLSIVIVAGLLLSSSFMYASGTAVSCQPKNQLRTEIAGLFAACPTEKFNLQEGGCALNLSFLINENKEIVNIIYQCENEALKKYAKHLVEKSSINVPGAIESKQYSISIVFKSAEM